MKQSWIRASGLLSAAGILLTSRAFAQNGYAIGEDIGSGKEGGGPVRMGRLSYLSGSVAYRTDGSSSWSAATVNLPARQGAELWAKAGSRAEFQFDDGSTMRLGGSGMASIPTMYSDSSGEFSEIKLTSGLATFNLLHKVSEYQVDTPFCSVKAFGPANFRVGVGSLVEIVVRSGEVQIQGTQGTTKLRGGDRLQVSGGSSGYKAVRAPGEDTWDHFCENREVQTRHHNRYLPSNIDLVAGNLDACGTWENDPGHGEVWCPTVSSSWRPYSNGQWTWVSPAGWTWVDADPWGWAPSHYGSWTRRHNRWAWYPGPSHQYWSPAVVYFSDYHDRIAWAPLSPDEVRYPAALSIGFSSGDWALSFSIGGAACYYPSSGGYCDPRPWDSGYFNREVVYNTTVVNNYYGSARPSFGRSNFVPRNALIAGGATIAATAAFVGGRHFDAMRGNQTAFFRQGNGFRSAPRATGQVAGPFGVRPTRGSFAPRGGSVSGPPRAFASRNVVRASVPGAVARQGGFFAHSVSPHGGPARVAALTAGRTVIPRAGMNRGVAHQPIAGRAVTAGRVTPGNAFHGRPLSHVAANPHVGSFAHRPASIANQNRATATHAQRLVAHSAPAVHNRAIVHRQPAAVHHVNPTRNVVHRQPARTSTHAFNRPAPRRVERRSSPVRTFQRPSHVSQPRVEHRQPSFQRQSQPRSPRPQQRSQPRPQQRSQPRQQHSGPQGHQGGGGRDKKHPPH